MVVLTFSQLATLLVLGVELSAFISVRQTADTSSRKTLKDEYVAASSLSAMVSGMGDESFVRFDGGVCDSRPAMLEREYDRMEGVKSYLGGAGASQ